MGLSNLRKRAKPFQSWAQGVDSRPVRLWVACAFLILAILIGGGSRSDIASVPILRAFAVPFGAYAIWAMPKGNLNGLGKPLCFLGVLACWMLLQLVPLPASWWSALPGRASVFSVDMLLGQGEIWRPLSLTPTMTWNSILSLLVPVAAMLLFAAVDRADFPRLAVVVIFAAVASAVLGLLQIWSGGDHFLYFYRITNNGSMVGFFSNRNHHAIFLACSLLFVGAAQRSAMLSTARAPAKTLGLTFVALFLVVIIIAIGSRGGLITGFSAVIAFALMVWPLVLRGPAKDARARRGRASPFMAGDGSAKLRRAAVTILPLLALATLAYLFAVSGQSNAISRGASLNYASDMRGQTLPVLLELMRTHWLFGTGFGSFSPVYMMLEPDALLQQEYFNHAHNDWGQMVIEGGLPMIVLVLFGIGWACLGLGRLIAIAWRSRGAIAFSEAVVLATAAYILAASSLGDYPLRTPSIMALAALLAVGLVRATESAKVILGASR